MSPDPRAGHVRRGSRQSPDPHPLWGDAQGSTAGQRREPPSSAQHRCPATDTPLKPTPRPQLLNCLMDMVEKTRRSLMVLRRCQEADREELNHWIRRCSDTEDLKGPLAAATRPLGSSGAQGSQLGGCPGGPGWPGGSPGLWAPAKRGPDPCCRCAPGPPAQGPVRLHA